MLDLLGLDELSETVYLTILRNPKVTVTDIASKLGWPESHVCAELAKLAEMSLVRPSYDVSGALHPVAPQVGLEALYQAKERDLRRRQAQLASSKLALEDIIAQHSRRFLSRSLPDIEFLPGFDELVDRMWTLTEECESELLSFVPTGPHEPAAESIREMDRASALRGVRMRVVRQTSVINDHATASHMKWIAAHGVEIRTTPVLRPRMVVFDARVAVVPLDPDHLDAGTIVATGTGVLTALCELFEQVWASALPAEEDQSPSDDNLTAAERAVIGLLSQGHTDEAVARKLGVSVRTARRITAGLTSKLGARSRFEAGVLAVQRGWLPETA